MKNEIEDDDYVPSGFQNISQKNEKEGISISEFYQTETPEKSEPQSFPPSSSGHTIIRDDVPKNSYTPAPSFVTSTYQFPIPSVLSPIHHRSLPPITIPQAINIHNPQQRVPQVSPTPIQFPPNIMTPQEFMFAPLPQPSNLISTPMTTFAGRATVNTVPSMMSTVEAEILLKNKKKAGKMEIMERLKRDREARRALKRAQNNPNKLQKRIIKRKVKKEKKLIPSPFEVGGSANSEKMKLQKDTFVIRLKDVDSFHRNNEIWRIDNHMLMQKFTGVPSFRAPARQFQSTNRMTGYDARASWRFFIIDPDNVEFDLKTFEITIHNFPPINILREAKQNAEKKDIEFKDVENGEYHEKLRAFQEKQEKRQAEKMNRKLLRRKKKLEMKYNSMKTRTENRPEVAYKLPKNIWRQTWFESNRKNKQEEEEILDECRRLLNGLIDAIVEHEEDGDDDDDEDDDEGVASESISDDSEEEKGKESLGIFYESDLPQIGCELTLNDSDCTIEKIPLNPL